MDQEIVINGIKYVPEASIRRSGNRAIIVVDRGWIFAGDVEHNDGFIYLSRAVWLFRWESVGFAAVVSDPSKADIRKIDDVQIPGGSEIFRIPVSDDWGCDGCY